MSVAAFYRRFVRAWRVVSGMLWPTAPEDPRRVERHRLQRRLQRVQARMLQTRQLLAALTIQQRRRVRHSRKIHAFVAARLGSAEAFTASLQLERLRQSEERCRKRRERLEQRYARLHGRFAELRQRWKRLQG
jgi:hypothetical protein